MVASLIMTMLTSEDQLMHSVKLLIDAHPAVVNARDPETGASLLQFVIAHANQAKLLDLLLGAQCHIGLQADARGRTCLHTALEQGKWHSLQQLLEALRHRRFSIIPGSMRLVAECFEAIAHDYPLDFLHYIANMPLDPEPEVLGDFDAFDVMLPSVLLCGSAHRCPKGIWKSKLAQYSRSNGQEEDAPTMDMLNPTSSARVSHAGDSPTTLERQKSGGRLLSMAKVKRNWSGSGEEASPAGFGSEAATPAAAKGVRRPGSGLGMGPEGGRPTTAQRMQSFKGPAGLGPKPGASAAEEKSIEMGYNKKAGGGLQAYRVPIENFAGMLDHGPHQVAPLQLVVDAVDATHEYSVFGSQLMKHLIEFKWHGFAKTAFYREFFSYVLHMLVVLFFNLRSSATLHYTFDDVLGRSE